MKKENKDAIISSLLVGLALAVSVAVFFALSKAGSGQIAIATAIAAVVGFIGGLVTTLYIDDDEDDEHKQL